MKKGFTLAEVLITLGVIGVVAALTLPNLLQNHQKKVFVTQLQRTVNLVSNSATALMGDNNAASLADSYLVAVNNDYKNAQGKFMNTYFKVARDCGMDNRAACLGDTYYSLDRSQSFDLNSSSYLGGTSGNSWDFYCVTINTGATVCMTQMHPDYTWSYTDKDGTTHTLRDHGSASVVVDVNGPSGPNTNGRDLFQFDLYSDGRIGNSYSDGDKNHYEAQVSGSYCQDRKSEKGYGGSCFQHIMANGWVMDY